MLGGEDADITDWPFMVSVQNTLGSLLYGGVLIDSTHVLTSGFCVDLGAPYAVYPLLAFFILATFAMNRFKLCNILFWSLPT